jgi:hypothetical protein
VILALAALLTAVGAGNPARAEAYIGESLVENAGKLTSAAEKVVKSPGYIPELITKARNYGGEAAASNAARVFQVGKVIPAIGVGWLGYEAGEGIGKEICNMFGLGWCMSQTQEVANPAPLSSGSWTFVEGPLCASNQTAVGYAYKWSAGTCSQPFFGVAGNVTNCGIADPGGGIFVETGQQQCGGPWHLQYYGVGFLYRHGTAGRSYGWSGSDTALPNYAYTQPNGWEGTMDDALGAANNAESDRVGQAIAHEIAPNTVANPYALDATVPNCDGMIWATCEVLIEEAGLQPQRSDLGWEGAHVEKPAGMVVETSPAGGMVVEKGGSVTVVTNPDEAGMPILIPQPQPGETYNDYIARLNPQLQPEKVTLTDASMDPDAGPNTVVTTAPAPGSRLPPNTNTPVNVRVNPPTAPIPAGPGGGDCDTNIGAIDFSPLMGLDFGNRFPFGVFVFLWELLSEYEVGGGAPKWSLNLLPEGSFGSENGIILNIDFGFLSPYIEPFRVVMLLLTFFGMLWFLATAAMKIQGDNS